MEEIHVAPWLYEEALEVSRSDRDVREDEREAFERLHEAILHGGKQEGLIALADLTGRDAQNGEPEWSATGQRRLARLSPAERTTVRQTLAFVEERLEQRISLSDLERHVGRDRYHIIHAFRRGLGAPPYSYVTHLRVARARDLIRDGQRPAHVASAVGFFDQSHLHRHFRRLLGVTPAQYAAEGCPWSDARGGATSARQDRTRKETMHGVQRDYGSA